MTVQEIDEIAAIDKIDEMVSGLGARHRARDRALRAWTTRVLVSGLVASAIVLGMMALFLLSLLGITAHA